MDLTALEALFTLRDDLAQPLADLAAQQLDEPLPQAGPGRPDTGADKADKQVQSALEKALDVRRGVAALLEKRPSDDGSLSGLLAAVTTPFLLTDQSPGGPAPAATPVRTTPKRVVKKPK